MKEKKIKGTWETKTVERSKKNEEKSGKRKVSKTGSEDVRRQDKEYVDLNWPDLRQPNVFDG